MDLWKICQMANTAKCICVVGSGGKTSLLYDLANIYRKQGKTVLVTTTTKMYIPNAYTVLSGDILDIQQKIKQWGFVVAGIPCGDGKMQGFPQSVRKQVLPLADMVLVEADGAKRLPLKMPNDTEPVLPKACDFLVTVVGLSCLGKSLGQVCHRWQLTAEFGYHADMIVTEEMVVDILHKGYATYWSKYAGCMFVNQVDCVTKEQATYFTGKFPITTILGSLQSQKRGITEHETI